MAESGFYVRARSPFVQSAAFPPGAGPAYVNAVVEIETVLSPDETVARLHEIEALFGRVRGERWSARILDLDLLALGNHVLPDRATHDRWARLSLDDQKRLTPDRLILPHPRIADRAFVLVPLAEIAPDWRHPVTGRTAAQMRDALGPDLLSMVSPV